MKLTKAKTILKKMKRKLLKRRYVDTKTKENVKKKEDSANFNTPKAHVTNGVRLESVQKGKHAITDILTEFVMTGKTPKHVDSMDGADSDILLTEGMAILLMKK